MLLISPAFCMENYTPYENKKTEEQSLPQIPHDVFENEILLRTLIDIIKECVSSEETDNIKNFFEKINNLFVNKNVKDFIRKYIPARKDGDMHYLPFMSLLVFAAKQNNIKLCKLILDNTKPTKSGFLASFFGDSEILDLIIKQNPDLLPTKEDFSELRIDAKTKTLDTNALQNLLNCLEEENDFITVGNINMAFMEFVMELLILRGMNVNLTLKNGAFRNGETLLMAAAYGNHTNIVKLLLACPKIRVNEKSLNGQTALHNAVTRKNKSIVALLLKNGVDTTIKYRGKTILEIAKEFNAGQDIINLLENN